MISPEDRFWVVYKNVFPQKGGRCDRHEGCIIDWDQRRWYLVHSSTKLTPPEEEKEIDILKRYINELPPDVQTFTVNDDGVLESVDAKHDPTMLPYYPRYSDTPSLHNCSTIRLSDLTELDRLGPGVDLMSYIDEGAIRKVAFKYSIINQWMKHIWEEMHLVKSLRHPNLVPFDHVVVDDIESRVLGFTTKFIPGGTFDEERARVFRFEWLEQLTAAVDYINLELGVVHQDVAPRNLLVDPGTDKIQLFDFDRAVPVSKADPLRNDVKGVIFTLYEILTEDEQFREVPFEVQDPDQVQKLEQWPVRCKLDSDVSRFREHLNAWVQRRTADAVNTPTQVGGPDTPGMPPMSPVFHDSTEPAERYYYSSPPIYRADLVKQKRNVVVWERPPQQQQIDRRP